MTSKDIVQAYVWIWLPGTVEPVVAGKIETDNGVINFNYGRSYLERIAYEHNAAISIYSRELPLQPGILPLKSGLNMPSCIRDSAPDAWGRRVILNKNFGRKSVGIDVADLDEITYLLESGSDRIGALDFQRSPTEYVPRLDRNASLEELLESAERVEKGIPLTQELDHALFHGTSIGGARPKALIEHENKKYIAKFSSSSDIYSVVKAEFIAMRLANLVGINVAPVKLVKASGKDVLLIERFDREKSQDGWCRKLMVSALTILELDDMMARYASYETLAEMIRFHFDNPKETLKELCSRLIFNILCGNTDDHARNHAAYWDGKILSLTPAYDICPQGRTGNEASQAMLISGNNRMSNIASVAEAANNFLMSEDEVVHIAMNQKDIIIENWDGVCNEADLSIIDRNLLWRRQFLNPFCFQGL